MSSCTNSTRAAEQRWPAEVNAEAIASFTSCSGSAEESAISAFWPPVSAISTPIAASRAASARLIARAVSVEPVKATPATRGSLRQRGADGGAVARQELQHGFRHAGFVQQLHRVVADQVGLLGRLGDHAVAGGERGGDLADEDRQREIPRADADEHAAAVQLQRRWIRRSGRAALRAAEQLARLRGVVAQEIDRLAHFGDAVGDGLAGFLACTAR